MGGAVRGTAQADGRGAPRENSHGSVKCCEKRVFFFPFLPFPPAKTAKRFFLLGDQVRRIVPVVGMIVFFGVGEWRPGGRMRKQDGRSCGDEASV